MSPSSGSMVGVCQMLAPPFVYASESQAGGQSRRDDAEAPQDKTLQGIVHRLHAASRAIAPIDSKMRVGGKYVSVIVTPNGASASAMALVNAAGAPMAPPSPTPRKFTSPSGGVSRWWTSIVGTSVVVGSR